MGLFSNIFKQSLDILPTNQPMPYTKSKQTNIFVEILLFIKQEPFLTGIRTLKIYLKRLEEHDKTVLHRSRMLHFKIPITHLIPPPPLAMIDLNLISFVSHVWFCVCGINEAL